MAAKRKPGRPTSFDAATTARVIALAGASVPRRHIADACGISISVMCKWIMRGRRGNKGDEEHVLFYDALKKAEAEAVAVSVGRIRRAANGGAVLERTTTTTVGPDGKPVTKVTEKIAQPVWTADAWLLERRYPEEFSANRAELRELQRAYKALEDRLLKLAGADGATPVVEKPA